MVPVKGSYLKMLYLSLLTNVLFPQTFTTFVYRKPNFSGVSTHFDSFLPSTYKFGTVYTIAYRCLLIRSSCTKLHN